MSVSLSRGDVVKIYIDGISSQGMGVGRVDGMAVFVAQALPGEVVQAQISNIKKNFAQAKILSVEEASQQRINSSCSIFRQCGGCVWQHTDYDTELKLKADIVQQALQRIGGQKASIPLPLKSADEWHYRNRVVFHFSHGELGFYNSGTHSLCSNACCDLLRPSLNQAYEVLVELCRQNVAKLAGLREIAIRCNSRGDSLLISFVADKHIQAIDMLATFLAENLNYNIGVWECLGRPVYSVYGSKWRHVYGLKEIEDNIGPVVLHLSPGSFLQVNPQQTVVMYDLVRQWAKLEGKETVFDLYSGAGSIAMYLAPYADRVYGIESYAPAVDNALRNAQYNNIDNCSFYAGATEELLPKWVDEGQIPHVVVLDPPRAGCDRKVLDALISSATERIVYVSCNPASLARDIKLLSDGGYFLQKVQPIDMFPKTAHCECVCLLTRKEI